MYETDLNGVDIEWEGTITQLHIIYYQMKNPRYPTASSSQVSWGLHCMEELPSNMAPWCLSA